MHPHRTTPAFHCLLVATPASWIPTVVRPPSFSLTFALLMSKYLTHSPNLLRPYSHRDGPRSGPRVCHEANSLRLSLRQATQYRVLFFMGVKTNSDNNAALVFPVRSTRGERIHKAGSVTAQNAAFAEAINDTMATLYTTDTHFLCRATDLHSSNFTNLQIALVTQGTPQPQGQQHQVLRQREPDDPHPSRVSSQPHNWTPALCSLLP